MLAKHTVCLARKRLLVVAMYVNVLGSHTLAFIYFQCSAVRTYSSGVTKPIDGGRELFVAVDRWHYIIQ